MDHSKIYRGAEYAVNFVPKLKLEVAIQDAGTIEVVDTLSSKFNIGQIFILPIRHTLRVRTGETSAAAL